MIRVEVNQLADPKYLGGLSQDHKDWIYNGLDSVITYDLANILGGKVRETNSQHTYDFEMGMCGPALTMMRRGLRIDEDTRSERARITEGRHAALVSLIKAVVVSAFDEFDAFNPSSPVQTKKLFYRVLNIVPIKKFEKGVWKVGTGREQLEKIIALYPRGKFFAEILLEIRATAKDLEVLNVARDEDKKLRCSYNVAGTETGRWSSSQSSFRSGTNHQNIRKDIREIVVPDPGYKLFYSDLDQAESRVVAYISGDQNYIDACEGPDLHTAVVKMVWPTLPWTGDPEKDRAIAERKFYREFTYRDLAKRAGHGTNYGLGYASMSRHLHIEQMHANRFQLLYLGGEVQKSSLERWHKQAPDGGFDYLMDIGERIGADLLEIGGAFAGIRRWHDDVAEKLQTEGSITTAMGRRRMFWGRPNEDTTLREAIAYEPQSTVGELLNVGLYRVWSELEPETQILGQVHDAVLGQFPENLVDKCSQDVLDCMINPLEINGNTMTIPASIDVGDNWKVIS